MLRFQVVLVFVNAYVKDMYGLIYYSSVDK